MDSLVWSELVAVLFDLRVVHFVMEGHRGVNAIDVQSVFPESRKDLVDLPHHAGCVLEKMPGGIWLMTFPSFP